MPRRKPIASEAIADLNDLALMRLPQVLSVFPISKSSWWEGVASGHYPRPLRISKRIAVWRRADIYRLLESVTSPDHP